MPYPSISKSEDLADGSKSVTINGAAVCLSSSRLARSAGDEAGTGGGIVSGTRGGPARPLTWSFDVSIEGKPVVRNLDLFLSNGNNTPPAPIVQAQSAPPLPVRVSEVKTPPPAHRDLPLLQEGEAPLRHEGTAGQQSG